MSVSDDIRALGRQGIPTAEIARRLGIRYQHAYGVLQAGLPRSGRSEDAAAPLAVSPPAGKPPLTGDYLTAHGFAMSGRWILTASGGISLEGSLPTSAGVYAFAEADVVKYIGVATIGLRKRLYFYKNPGSTQLTNVRLNGILRERLSAGAECRVWTACPPDLDWNGLPIHGSAGLELGLIRTFELPWNQRSAAAVGL
jgi:hypothetical protein